MTIESNGPDNKKMLGSIEMLKRLKEMKGQKLPGSMQGLHDMLKEKVGEHSEIEKSDEFKEANEALDMLAAMKKGKAIEKSEASEEAEKTKTCAKCGVENLVNANFCKKCGNAYEKSDAERLRKIAGTIKTLKFMRANQRLAELRGEKIEDDSVSFRVDLENRFGALADADETEPDAALKLLNIKISLAEEAKKTAESKGSEKTKICANCGAEALTMGDKFCNKCGNKFQTLEEEKIEEIKNKM
jgi:ribosomal protein L40E